VYTTQIKSDSKLVWLLFPSEKVETGIRAEIISESPKGVKVSVTDQKENKWNVTVPL
jgi:hypothetical protein